MEQRRDISMGSTGYLLWQVALKWRVAADRELAPLGLTHAKYALLASLYGLARAGVRPSQRELADYSGLEPMYVSRLARVLASAGLVERSVSTNDPRAVELALTPRGSEVIVEAISVVRRLQDRLLAPLGGGQGERTKQLRESLQVLLRSAPAAADDAEQMRKGAARRS